jgi:hypothetical protein
MDETQIITGDCKRDDQKDRDIGKNKRVMLSEKQVSLQKKRMLIMGRKI